jgi:DNA ligase-1
LKWRKPDFVEVAPKEECKGIDHMHQFLQDIIDEGGEGIILRDPFSPYQAGRSPGFLKHKVRLFSHLM